MSFFSKKDDATEISVNTATIIVSISRFLFSHDSSAGSQIQTVPLAAAMAQ
jgi:hypothetical protein